MDILAMAFDLGGTKLTCGTVTANFDVVNYTFQLIPNFTEHSDVDSIWQHIINTIVSYCSVSKVNEDVPVVLAFPGPISANGNILQAPTLIGDESSIPNIREIITKKTNRRVFILNDLSAATWYIGQQNLYDRFMVLNIGSGIGSKIFDRNNANSVFDELPYGGEIGHARVDYSVEAPQCDCGGRGHLGAISSGRGILRYAKKMAKYNPTQFSKSLCVREFGATVSNLSNEQHIVPAALRKDSWAIQIIYESTLPLAHALLLITLATGLEKIVLIGGFVEALGYSYVSILKTALIKSNDYLVIQNSMDDLVELQDRNAHAFLIGGALYANNAKRSL